MTDPNKTIIPPTVGRVVWYYLHPAADEHMARFNTDGAARPDPLAAIIAAVDTPERVNLVVYDANGVSHPRKGVALLQRDAGADWYGAYCTWMPYQKGQAAKTEAAELRAAAASTGPAPQPEQSPTAFSFGMALDLLKQGHRVSRSGWNGKGMWLELQRPDAASKMTLPYLYLNYPIDARTTPGARVPWLASQTDMLAEDWVQVA